MAYKLNVNGIEIVCDTLDEMLAVVRTGTAASTPTVSQPPTVVEPEPEPAKPSQGSGPKRIWAEAQEFAKKHNMGVYEARSILARKRKEAVAAAVAEVKAKMASIDE